MSVKTSRRELSPLVRKGGHVLACIAVAGAVVAIDITWAFLASAPSYCDTCERTDGWDTAQQGIAVVGVAMTWAVFVFLAAGFRKVAGWLALSTLAVALLWLAVLAATAG